MYLKRGSVSLLKKSKNPPENDGILYLIKNSSGSVFGNIKYII